MAWAPKVTGNQVYAIDTKTGSVKWFGGSSGRTVISASMTGPDEMAIQLDGGGVIVWNVETGSYMIYD